MRASSVGSPVKLSDVAAAANVSVPAASMALSNNPRISLQTRRRVWAECRRLGYRRQATPRGRPTSAPDPVAPPDLGCVCLGANFSRPINARCFAEITAFASRLDIRLRTACVEDLSSPERVRARLLRFAQSLNGLVMTGTVTAPDMQAIAEAQIPCVVMGDPVAREADTPLDVVTFDHQAAGRLAAAHLLSRGHRHVAFLCDTLHPGASNSRWLDGYRLAHIDAGLPMDESLIGVTGVIDGGLPPVLDAMIRLPSPPTAYVVINAFLANTLLITLKEMGRRDEIFGLFIDKPPEIEGLFAIRHPIKNFCDIGMTRLVQLCQHPAEPPARIMVPFETFNLT